jgi:hypothetical protein
LKNNREPGADFITTEIIKSGCRMMWRKIYICIDADRVEETAKAR